MSIKNVMKANDIFSYIVIHLAIVLAVIFIMGGYLYRFFYNTLYDDFRTGSMQYITAIVNRHENDIQMLDDIVMQLGLADDVTRFRLEYRPEVSIKLKEHLKGYTTVSQFFDMILYQYHKDDYMYNHTTSINTDYFVEKGCVLEKIPSGEFKDIILSEARELRIIPEQGVNGRWIDGYLGVNSEAAFYVQAIAPEFDETVLFFVPGSYFDELLEDDIDNCKNFLIYNGEVIASRGCEYIDNHVLYDMWMKENMEAEIGENTEADKEIMLEGERYLLSVQKGSSGIIYGTLQPMEVFYEKIRTEQWFVIILIFACMVPASFAILYFSGKMLKKVKRMSLLLTEDSSYDLNRIESGIQTLVDMRKTSEKENLDLKKARFIRDFIRKNWESKESVVAEAGKVGLNIFHDWYVVALIRNKELNNEDKVYSLLLEAICTEKESEGYGIHLVNNNQNLFVIWGNTQEKLESILNKMLVVEKKYCQDFVIATSDFHSDINESSTAYLEADTAFNHHLLISNSEIIRFNDVVKMDYNNFSMEHYLKRLKQAIRSNDKDTSQKVIADVCEKIKSENISLYAFRILYNDTLQMLMSECKTNKLQLEHFYNVFTLSQCFNIQDFYDLLSEACQRIIDSQEGKNIENSDIVKKAIMYMHQNYHNPNLTMNSLADYLNVSSVTLSIEFKSEMEIKPSEYLANLRMEKAKELLGNTSMLIKDISMAIGYEDDCSFTRRFKKYTGMTPGQFRER